MRVRALPLLLTLMLLVSIGCQPLKYEKTFNLMPLETKDITFSAPSYAQKVMVTITPTNTGVSAYLCKSVDYPQVNKALDSEKEPPASLLLGSRVSKSGAESYSFEATVPAKTEYILALKNSKKTTEVKVLLVGR